MKICVFRHFQCILKVKFNKVEQRVLLGVEGKVYMSLFIIYSSFQRWKFFENRSIFEKVTAKIREHPFWNTVYNHL
jgi:hypothetical protein